MTGQGSVQPLPCMPDPDLSSAIASMEEWMRALEPGSVLWTIVAEAREGMLRRHVATLLPSLRWFLLGEPTSVMDL